MKQLFTGAFVAMFVLCLSNVAIADSIAESWTCKVAEGKKIADVQAVNSKWLAWINAHVKGGGVSSVVGTPVVGDTESFIFVDTYPDIATWAAAKALFDSAEGIAIEGMFNEVSTCSENRLWRIEDTE
jgi:hypothetical protein